MRTGFLILATIACLQGCADDRPPALPGDGPDTRQAAGLETVLAIDDLGRGEFIRPMDDQRDDVGGDRSRAVGGERESRESEVGSQFVARRSSLVAR
jgi:hypothetical protein